MSGPSDEVLVARARTGDDEAFRQLVVRHQRRLFQLALGVVGDRDEAMDVVQEAFVKIHRHLDGFKGDAAFTTWSHRIAANLAIDALRRRKRHEADELGENDLTDADDEAPLGERAPEAQRLVLRGELGARIAAALETLSENHRVILVMREVDGLSYEELSETLKIPKGTVMSRLFHARHRLQEALRGYIEDGEAAPAPAKAQGGKR